MTGGVSRASAVVPPEPAAADRAERYAALIRRGYTLAEIGARERISAVRVGQVLRSAGLSVAVIQPHAPRRAAQRPPLPPAHPWTCAACGAQMALRRTGHDQAHFCQRCKHKGDALRFRADPIARARRLETHRRSKWRARRGVEPTWAAEVRNCANCGKQLVRRQPVTDPLKPTYCSARPCQTARQRLSRAKARAAEAAAPAVPEAEARGRRNPDSTPVPCGGGASNPRPARRGPGAPARAGSSG